MPFGRRLRRRRRHRQSCWWTNRWWIGWRQRWHQKRIRAPISGVVDEKVEKIYELLPKRDCGACGFDNCYDCAVAIASLRAPPDACRVVGKRLKDRIEQILREEQNP